jgi:CubicO group peptidase (beta-lactamase class C family)
MTRGEMNLQNLLQSHLADHGVVGAAAALWINGELETAAAGVADVESREPVTDRTAFGLASVTKMLTATHVMAVAGRGQLDLDTPLADVIPEYEPREAAAREGVTLRRVLSHTSGLAGEYMGTASEQDTALAELATGLSRVPLIHPPGAFDAYCNVGLPLAARAAEVTTGEVWETTLRHDLLEPAGMSDTVILRGADTRRGVARHHRRDPISGENALGRMWFSRRCMGPAGTTVHASVRDLIALARVHIQGGVGPTGQRVLSRSAVESMQIRGDALAPMTHPEARHGLGWWIPPTNGSRVVMHTGGGVNWLYVLPDERAALAFCSNSPTGTVAGASFCEQVLRERLKTEVVTADLGAEPPTTDPTGLERYVGVYRNASLRLDVTSVDGALQVASELEADDTNLPIMHDRHPEFRLTPVSKHVFSWQGGYAAFVFDDPDGPAQWFVPQRPFRRDA